MKPSLQNARNVEIKSSLLRINHAYLSTRDELIGFISVLLVMAAHSTAYEEIHAAARAEYDTVRHG